eukprot:scaffold2113_cov233-Pinguiococcus_pyrenoidosus.AAC.23
MAKSGVDVTVEKHLRFSLLLEEVEIVDPNRPGSALLRFFASSLLRFFASSLLRALVASQTRSFAPSRRRPPVSPAQNQARRAGTRPR